MMDFVRLIMLRTCQFCMEPELQSFGCLFLRIELVTKHLAWPSAVSPSPRCKLASGARGCFTTMQTSGLYNRFTHCEGKKILEFCKLMIPGRLTRRAPRLACIASERSCSRSSGTHFFKGTVPFYSCISVVVMTWKVN